MKYSIYNSIIGVGNSCLVYNGVADRFVVVKRCREDVVEKMTSLPSQLVVDDAVFYSRLMGIAAIVEDDVDEIGSLASAIAEVDNNGRLFHLQINPTLDCTFRCWYCYEDHHRGTRMAESTIEAIKRLVERRFDEQPSMRQFQLSFFGGEPLMYFNRVAAPIVDFVVCECEKHGVDWSVHFTTNAYLLSPSVSGLLGRYNTSLQITLDGSRESHDQVRCLPFGKGSYDRILSNVKSALSKGCSVILRINYTRDNLASVAAVIDDLESWNIEKNGRLRVDFQQVWQDRRRGEDSALEEMVNGYISRLRGIGIFGSVYFHSPVSKSSCYGDKRNHILVNYNGDLFQCTARDFKTERRSGFIADDGSLVWKNDALEHRMNCKFSRPVCHNCRIAPLCGGGCRT